MTDQLRKITAHQCSASPARYDDLKVLFLNCTLSRTPQLSHTEGLIRVAEKIFYANGVETQYIRPVDYEIPAGLGLDISKTDEWDRDDWPQIQAEVDACDILILGTSVWLGEAAMLPPKSCLNLYTSVWLMPNLDALGCSASAMSWGSIMERGLDSVWNEPEGMYVTARRDLRNQRVPLACEGCIYTGGFLS